MLYDGAVRFLNQAKAGFAEKNIEKIHNNIVKVQNIITEFESTLDMKTGGEFAQNLFALYEYINNQLLLANIKKREECLDEALKHMTELRDTWRQAVKQFKAAGHSLDENDMDHYNSRVSTSEPDDEDNEDDDKMGEYI